MQFVVSGKFIALFLIAAGLLGGGCYWYLKQQQVQQRFRTPPYFVNRGASIIRPCKQCLALGTLKVQSAWKIGQPTEIPATDQRWFLAVEDPPTPVEVSGVLMLPVHPTLSGNPALGFDKNQVQLVLYQGLQRMAAIEQPSPPAPAPSVVTADRDAPPTDQTANFGMHIQRLNNLGWRIEVPTDDQWHETGIPVIASQKVTARPSIDKVYRENEGHYSVGFGDYQYEVPEDKEIASRRGFETELTEDLAFVTGPDWLGTLSLKVPRQADSTFSLDVGLEYQEIIPTGHYRKGAESWEEHIRLHQQTRMRQEEILKHP